MLWGVSPDDATVDLLKTIRATGVQGVAVSWTGMGGAGLATVAA